MSFYWYRIKNKVYNEKDVLLGTMESEAIAQFVVELTNTYWLSIDKVSKEVKNYIDEMKKQNVTVIGITPMVVNND